MAMGFMSRRGFLSRSALAGAAALGVARVARAQASVEKLNIAAVGIGGMGSSNLRNLAGENIVALCDVDSTYAAKAFEAFPEAKRYKDYREMLAAQNDIDAVLIATPDHTHAVIAMACMKAGKHVYCQKPLTHDIYESRRLAETAKETGVVTQMGIQGHSGEGIRQVREWIQAGVIGEVREVDAWCSLTYYPWGHANWSSPLGTRPSETPPVPETLDWNLWLGPAPERPYHPCYHPLTWRSWWDFGCGMMGDRGAHTFDPIFWALDLGHPTSVDGSATDLNSETHPIACIVRYEFPARGAMPPVTLTWYDGVRAPRPKELSKDDELGHPEGGTLFKGSEGFLTCGVYGENPRLLPASRMKEFTPPAPSLPRVQGKHEDDWLNAIKNGTKAGADFSYSGPLTEVCLLGNVAKRMGTKLEWDPVGMKFPNMAEADPFVKTVYREGWSL
ncbi:MAG: Gfo/Idh/MocA family oxidoreductase [Candidatus Hydrogenedentes bacterium]|nr:Gfo/Idh/MocA family oxidoreductase [Candidatus Hydrogenedentota bacterium]